MTATGNAEELASKLRGVNCHVNLIPLNRVSETGLHGTERIDAERFRDYLEKTWNPGYDSKRN